MFYNEFAGKKLSALGFGAMRLPLLEDGVSVDEDHAIRMVRRALEGGINYFDTAYGYHNGQSELVLGKALEGIDRSSYYLASKFPGHQAINGSTRDYDPKETFEEQLAKCRTDYFDFYLLHNVYEESAPIYYDESRGIVDYLLEQKKNGRIKHLGFSAHALLPLMTEFLDRYGDILEFCQIQVNYLDWTLQRAKEKYELLESRGIPVWVMEPLRGGVLAKDGREYIEKGFRFISDLPEVKVILSGMSEMSQLEANLEIFEEKVSLTKDERNELLEKAEGMKDSLPCTACRYCCKDCPVGIDIPTVLSLYNESRVVTAMSISMTVDGMGDKGPANCIACGNCKRACPQRIDIPEAMHDFTERLKDMPHWIDMIKAREAADRERNS